MTKMANNTINTIPTVNNFINILLCYKNINDFFDLNVKFISRDSCRWH